jgi:cytochrome c peroxidase
MMARPLCALRVARGVTALTCGLLACSILACDEADQEEDSSPTLGEGDAPLSTGDASAGNAHGRRKPPTRGDIRRGKQLFDKPFPDTNGRACATCHVHEDHTALTPAHVSALFASDPGAPLFNRIDADDPNAPVPSYEHLKKGLVRVLLKLPENMDLIDLAGVVVTPSDRTVVVWRGVPTVENTALTAPYQLEGRATTLQEQAQGAIIAHSEGHNVGRRELDRIADFERALFSSDRARAVAQALERGTPLHGIPRPEDRMRLTAEEAHGREVYNKACEACHGGPTNDRIVNRAVHDRAFAKLKPDGNLLFQVPATNPPTPVPLPRDSEFINAGFGFFSYLGQLGAFPTFNGSVALPRYRYRFYTDGTRATKQVDLPPLPVTLSGDPADIRPPVDSDGNPIVGPNLLPQAFSTDPGRALITGDPADFEAFDVPQLRGIARTAPYFHDNSFATLVEVVDIYSRFTLQAFPPLNLPRVNPPEFEGAPPESLTPIEKRDLIAFLSRL